MTIRAVFENGVFRPIEKLELPDRCEVEVEIHKIKSESREPGTPMSEGLSKVYEILGRRHSSGCTDTAARQNEHQP